MMLTAHTSWRPCLCVTIRVTRDEKFSSNNWSGFDGRTVTRGAQSFKCDSVKAAQISVSLFSSLNRLPLRRGRSLGKTHSSFLREQWPQTGFCVSHCDKLSGARRCYWNRQVKPTFTFRALHRKQPLRDFAWNRREGISAIDLVEKRTKLLTVCGELRV